MGLLNFMKKDDKKSTDQAASSSTVQTTTTTVPSYNPAAVPAAPAAQPPVQTTEVVTQVAQPATSSGMSGGYSGMSGGQSPAPVMTEPQTTTVQLSSTETASPNGQAQQSSVAVSAADGAAPAATNAPTDPKAQKNEELDLMTHLTQRSNRVFVLASGKAKEYHNQFIDSEHMLFGLLSDSEIYKLLSELKVQPQNIEAELKNIFKSEQFTQNPQFSPRVKRIIDRYFAGTHVGLTC
jgi:hypothetical protein